jgi:hypothetical protein
MRRASLAALCLCMAAGTATAQQASTTDADGGMARLGVAAKAERIVHHGEPYLLVRLQVQDSRKVEKPGAAPDWVRVGTRGHAFLPVTIDCDAVTMESEGVRQKTHLLSPCSGALAIEAPFAMPVFVVFRYPQSGRGTVRIPVTVRPPAPPIATRRDAPPPSPDRIDESLVGQRTLILQVALP